MWSGRHDLNHDVNVPLPLEDAGGLVRKRLNDPQKNSVVAVGVGELEMAGCVRREFFSGSSNSNYHYSFILT